MGPRVICQWGRNYRCKTHGGWWTRRRRSRWSTTAEARKRSPEQRPIAGSTTTWTRSSTWRFWWKATRACGGRPRAWCCVVIFRGVQSSRDLDILRSRSLLSLLQSHVLPSSAYASSFNICLLFNSISSSSIHWCGSGEGCIATPPPATKLTAPPSLGPHSTTSSMFGPITAPDSSEI
jgi:hypothetical protein